MFRDALTAVSEAPPQLLDIAQLTARALPASQPPASAQPKVPGETN
jgi:hypothetical protein